MLDQVTFNDNVFELVSSRDMGYFFRAMLTDLSLSTTKDTRVFVNNASTIDDVDNPNMITVTIRFQLFNKKEIRAGGRGRVFDYKCYRAKDWSCSGTGISAATGLFI